MTDNLSNNIPTPFTPSGTPSVLPDSPPPQEVAVDPIPPLPSMSSSAANPPSKFGVPEPKVETVIAPAPPKPVEKPVTPPAPSVPEENPAIHPPGAQSAVGNKPGDPYVKKHHGLPKVTIAGIASLAFLVVALGSGLYLTRQKQDLQTLAEGCYCVDDGSCASGESTIPNIDCDNNRNGQGTACCGGSGGGRPTDSPPSQGCQPYDGSDCGGNNQGFCTRCPDGAGGRTEYYCNSPNVGSGGGCRAPSGGEGGGGGSVPTDSPRRVRVSYFCSTCQPGGICQENFTMGNGGLGNPCSQVDECDSNGQNCYGIQWCASSCSGGGGGGGGGGGPTTPPEQPTQPPIATPTPVTISANCESLVGQISNGAGGWTTKTDAEFAASARPGDGVRFVCTGHKTQGAFTKSAFFINNILHVDDVVKLNENQFAVEYTIPAAGSLEVESVLLHDTKGWVD